MFPVRNSRKSSRFFFAWSVRFRGRISRSRCGLGTFVRKGWTCVTRCATPQSFAFFNSAEEVNIDAPLPDEMEPYLREVETYRKKRKELLAKYRVPELQPHWENKLREARANPGKWQNWDKALGTVRVGAGHPVYGRGEKILLAPREKRSERDATILSNHFIQFYSQVVPPKVYEEERKFLQLRKELNTLEQEFPALSQAQTIAAEKKPRQTYIYRRGDFKRPGRPVDSGTPAFLYQTPATLCFLD